MSVTENQVQETLQAAADQTPAVAPPDTSDDSGNAIPTNAALAAMRGPAGGPETRFSAGMAPGILQAPRGSVTNAAVQPGSFGDKFRNAFMLLTRAGAGNFGEIATMAGTHALADTPAPSNTNWNKALTNTDQTPASTQPFATPDKSNGQKIIDAIAGNLADTSAATQGGPEGGAFAGVGRVLAAGQKRAQDQQDRQIAMAKANIEMLHEQQILHRTSEDAVNASAKMGAQSAEEMLLAPNSERLAQDKTSDELEQMIKSGAIDPSRDAVFLTGRKLLGNDANGLPQYRSTYSVIKPGDRIKLTEENLKFMNDNLHMNLQAGTELTSHDYYALNQRAMTNYANQQMIQKMMDETELREKDIKLSKGDAAFMTNPAWQTAISGVPHTGAADPYLPIKAYYRLMRMVAEKGPDGRPTPQAAQLMAELPADWDNQAKHAISGGGTDYAKNFQKLADDFGKVAEKAQDTIHNTIDDVEKKLNAATSPNEVDSNISAIETMKQDPKYQDALSQQKLTFLGNQATRTHDRMIKDEQDKIRQDQAIKVGSADELAQELADHLGTIDNLRARGATQSLITSAVAKANEITMARGEGKYSATLEIERKKAVGQQANEVFFGNVNSLIGQGGTLEQLEAGASQISQSDWQKLNDLKNWTAEEAGKAGIVGYAATAVGVADDYAKVMGGSVGSDKSRELVLSIIKPGLSPQQRALAVKNMAKAVWSQGDARIGTNSWLHDAYGYDLDYVAKKYGMPTRQKGPVQETADQANTALKNNQNTSKQQPAPQQTPAQAAQTHGLPVVMDGRGKPHYFNTQAEADNFRALIKRAQDEKARAKAAQQATQPGGAQ